MTIFTFIALSVISLVSGILGAVSMKMFDRFAKTDNNFNSLSLYSKVTRKDTVLLTDDKKSLIENITFFLYNAILGFIIPLSVFIVVPNDIVTASASKSFSYLLLLILASSVITHLLNLFVFSLFVNKENPFWKWEVKTNATESLKRLVYSIVSVMAFLLIGWLYIFILA